MKFLIFQSISLMCKLQAVQIESVIQFIDACHGAIGCLTLSGGGEVSNRIAGREGREMNANLFNNWAEESSLVPLRYSDWYWMENLRERRLAYLQREAMRNG
jgi:hypothetical protein